jgi:hypothetical protein
MTNIDLAKSLILSAFKNQEILFLTRHSLEATPNKDMRLCPKPYLLFYYF